MSFYAYILKSELTGQLYKGHCEGLAVRLKAHNAGKTKSTRHGIPWRVVYYEEFESREEAISRERYFKSGAGRRFISKMDL